MLDTLERYHALLLGYRRFECVFVVFLVFFFKVNLRLPKGYIYVTSEEAIVIHKPNFTTAEIIEVCVLHFFD